MVGCCCYYSIRREERKQTGLVSYQHEVKRDAEDVAKVDLVQRSEQAKKVAYSIKKKDSINPSMLIHDIE